MPKRVLLAGLFHETHTFLDDRTSLSDFQVRRGSELLDARGDGSPLSAVLESADSLSWDLLPSVDMRAAPGGTVDDAVLDFFWETFCSHARPELARGVDGIFLILHGAMVTETVRDVEGEIIRRIRNLPGAQHVPIGGVLDLHGNISESSITSAQSLVAYCANPHVDAHETAARAARLLDRVIVTGQRPVMVWDHPPVMWPPTATGTADDPLRTLEALARDIERTDAEIAAVNVFAGFSFADTPDTGVSFSAVTFGDASRARARLAELSAWTIANRELGRITHPRLEDVMPAIRAQAPRGRDRS